MRLPRPPYVLPQYGPGLKHTRKIELEPWQSDITQQRAGRFIRGLIHSNGCRFIAVQRKKGTQYEYARYMFANRSQDIIAIFRAHLNLVGVEWTQPSASHVQDARREAVLELDRHVGPKR